MKEILHSKQFLNAIEQVRQTLNKRGYDVILFSNEKTGFYIEKLISK